MNEKLLSTSMDILKALIPIQKEITITNTNELIDLAVSMSK